MRRSRKPVRAFRSYGGSNPPLSVANSLPSTRVRLSGMAACHETAAGQARAEVLEVLGERLDGGS